MIALVTGGASSGKSAFAERLALLLPGPHWYVASMRPGGAEAARRIARHRRLRAGKGFRTVELAGGLRVPPCGTALLEDMGNLVANGWEARLDEVLACPNAVIVGNEVGADGVRYAGFTGEYVRRLGALSCRLAARADLVVEVVAGLPLVAKGQLPAGIREVPSAVGTARPSPAPGAVRPAPDVGRDAPAAGDAPSRRSGLSGKASPDGGQEVAPWRS